MKAGEEIYRLTIDVFHCHRMTNGLDSIGLIPQHDDAIAPYEEKQPALVRQFVHRSAFNRQKEKSQQIATAGVVINTNTQSYIMSANQQSE